MASDHEPDYWGIEYVLWATKIGEPDYKAHIITSVTAGLEGMKTLDKARAWAMANGFNRLRVSKCDPSDPTPFTTPRR